MQDHAKMRGTRWRAGAPLREEWSVLSKFLGTKGGETRGSWVAAAAHRGHVVEISRLLIVAASFLDLPPPATSPAPTLYYPNYPCSYRGRGCIGGMPGVAAPFRTLRLTRKRWSDEVDEEPELGWWPSAPRTR